MLARAGPEPVTGPSKPSLKDACAALEATARDPDRVFEELGVVDRLWAAVFVMSAATFRDRSLDRACGLKTLRRLLVEDLSKLLEGLLLETDSPVALLGARAVLWFSPHLSEAELAKMMKIVVERSAIARDCAVLWLLGAAGAGDERWYRLLSGAGGERLLPLLGAGEAGDRIARSFLAGRDGL